MRTRIPMLDTERPTLRAMMVLLIFLRFNQSQHLPLFHLRALQAITCGVLAFNRPPGRLHLCTQPALRTTPTTPSRPTPITKVLVPRKVLSNPRIDHVAIESTETTA